MQNYLQFSVHCTEQIQIYLYVYISLHIYNLHYKNFWAYFTTSQIRGWGFTVPNRPRKRLTQVYKQEVSVSSAH